MPPAPIRVIVLSPYPAVRAGLRAMIDGLEGIEVVGESAPALLEGEAPPEADIVVADLGDDAEETVAAVEDLLPAMPAVLLAFDPEAYRRLPPAGGPRAYLLRDADAGDLLAAVRAVARGLTVLHPSLARPLPAAGPLDGAAEPAPESLTPREREVLELLALGLPNKAIALRLGVSDSTVKFHVGAILSKLGAAGRTEAVMLAARRGLLPL